MTSTAERFDTAWQLARIPELAALVYVENGRLYRPPADVAKGREKHTKASLGPKVPVDVTGLVEETALLYELTQAVRATLEEARRLGDYDLTATEPPTWVSETKWLSDQTERWEADDYLADYVPSQIRMVYRRLTRVVEGPNPPRYLCHACNGWLDRQHGALVCKACGQIYHAADIAHELGKQARLVGLREAARLIGRPVVTLHRWVKAGLVRDHGKHQYDLDDFRKVADMVREDAKIHG